CVFGGCRAIRCRLPGGGFARLAFGGGLLERGLGGFAIGGYLLGGNFARFTLGSGLFQRCLGGLAIGGSLPCRCLGGGIVLD
ncbi:hypothetical protein, partial [Burkholderia gladioli]|uniref:hypothetical protein n=1 Tax=Burkholderia gladioli TaxID=28095 RepID=UPI001ABA94C1